MISVLDNLALSASDFCKVSHHHDRAEVGSWGGRDCGAVCYNGSEVSQGIFLF